MNTRKNFFQEYVESFVALINLYRLIGEEELMEELRDRVRVSLLVVNFFLVPLLFYYCLTFELVRLIIILYRRTFVRLYRFLTPYIFVFLVKLNFTNFSLFIYFLDVSRSLMRFWFRLVSWFFWCVDYKAVYFFRFIRWWTKVTQPILGYLFVEKVLSYSNFRRMRKAGVSFYQYYYYYFAYYVAVFFRLLGTIFFAIPFHYLNFFLGCLFNGCRLIFERVVWFRFPVLSFLYARYEEFISLSTIFLLAFFGLLGCFHLMYKGKKYSWSENSFFDVLIGSWDPYYEGWMSNQPYTSFMTVIGMFFFFVCVVTSAASYIFRNYIIMVPIPNAEAVFFKMSKEVFVRWGSYIHGWFMLWAPSILLVVLIINDEFFKPRIVKWEMYIARKFGYDKGRLNASFYRRLVRKRSYFYQLDFYFRYRFDSQFREMIDFWERTQNKRRGMVSFPRYPTGFVWPYGNRYNTHHNFFFDLLTKVSGKDAFKYPFMNQMYNNMLRKEDFLSKESGSQLTRKRLKRVRNLFGKEFYNLRVKNLIFTRRKKLNHSMVRPLKKPEQLLRKVMLSSILFPGRKNKHYFPRSVPYFRSFDGQHMYFNRRVRTFLYHRWLARFLKKKFNFSLKKKLPKKYIFYATWGRKGSLFSKTIFRKRSVLLPYSRISLYLPYLYHFRKGFHYKERNFKRYVKRKRSFKLRKRNMALNRRRIKVIREFYKKKTGETLAESLFNPDTWRVKRNDKRLLRWRKRLKRKRRILGNFARRLRLKKRRGYHFKSRRWLDYLWYWKSYFVDKTSKFKVSRRRRFSLRWNLHRFFSKKRKLKVHFWRKKPNAARTDYAKAGIISSYDLMIFVYKKWKRWKISSGYADSYLAAFYAYCVLLYNTGLDLIIYVGSLFVG